MAYFISVLKANELKYVCETYKKEKFLSIIKSHKRGTDLEADDSSDKELLIKKKSRFQSSLFGKHLLRYKTKNTKEYFIAKSFFGFMGGILLTYILFAFFIFGLRLSLQTSTYACMVVGIVLSLGMAFSRRIRCYVLLTIPVFFTKQGRQVIVAYAFFLSFTGPAKNTMHNLGILTDSLICGQEMIRKTMREIADMVKAPFRSVKNTLSRIAKALQEMIDKMKDFFDNIKRIILGILNTIKIAVSWLGNIINFCNKKLGTPFQRCMKTFDDAIEDCKAKMGLLDFLCYVVHVVQALCYTVKFLDLICLFSEFVSDVIIDSVKKKLKDFGLQVKAMFYVSIEFTHNYEFTSEASNTTKEIAGTILHDMSQKIEKFDKIFNKISWAFSFFFIFIFFRVLYYKHKYMSSDRYDNYYISNHILELDMKRAKMNKETVLPLEHREKKHFAWPTAIRLLDEEKENIVKNLLIMGLTTLKIFIYVASDYSLYWVLFTIYRLGHADFTEVQETEFGIHVEGKGPLAEFYRKLGKTLKIPNNRNLQIDSTQCLPDPTPPDKDRYIQITYLLSICWFLAVTEPYGLRLRNIVMSHYHPDRAKERAVWLYNHILRSRGSFLRFARRQLRRRIKSSSKEPIDKVSVTQRIFAKFPLLGHIFQKNEGKTCMVCFDVGSEEMPLKKCSTPHCPGTYCFKCFTQLKNVCTICQHPIEYGDISDISEEKDSSEDSLYQDKRDDSEENAHTASETEEELTFEDMETRPKFKDLEENRRIHFAKKEDLEPVEDLIGQQELEFGGKKLGKYEAFKLLKKRAKKLIRKLKDDKAKKLQVLRNRKKNLLITLRNHVGKKYAKKSHGLNTKISNANVDGSKYKHILQKTKLLTKKLKLIKSNTGTIQPDKVESFSSDEDNNRDMERKPLLTWKNPESFKYESSKNASISRDNIFYAFEKAAQPFSGASSKNYLSTTNLNQKKAPALSATFRDEQNYLFCIGNSQLRMVKVRDETLQQKMKISYQAIDDINKEEHNIRPKINFNRTESKQCKKSRNHNLNPKGRTKLPPIPEDTIASLENLR